MKYFRSGYHGNLSGHNGLFSLYTCGARVGWMGLGGSQEEHLVSFGIM